MDFETIMKIGTDDWRNGIWRKKYDTYLQRIFEEDGKEIYRQIFGGVRVNFHNEGLILRDRSYNTGGSSDEGSEEEEQEQEQGQPEEKQEINPVREKMKMIMELLFENKEKIQEGLYLQLSNEMTELYELTS